MKQGKKTLQEAFKTFHLIARFGKGLFLLAFLVSSLNAVAPLLIVVGNTQILNEIVNRKSQNVPLLIAYFYVVAGFSYVIAAFLQRDLEIKLVQANEQ
ncbi:MAG: ABC transporter ATP-binding protein, partial [Leuconostoc pseudomesenteroides]